MHSSRNAERKRFSEAAEPRVHAGSRRTEPASATRDSELARQRATFARFQREGSREDLRELVVCFTPLARGLARRYKHSSEPYEDLCQVAQVGLINAIHRYDPDRGFPFHAFAVPTILGELRRHFRNSAWAVHVPRRLQERALYLRDTERALNEQYGRSVSVPELSQFTELSVEQVLEAMHVLNSFASVSIDAPRPDDSSDGGAPPAETIGTEDPRFELVEERVSLRGAIEQLEPPQRDLLRMSYIEEMTQKQIAQRTGVSQMAVSRRLQRCISDLRELTGVAA